MTKEEYESLKQNPRSFINKLKERLNYPKTPSINDDKFDEIRSKNVSLDKNIKIF